MSDELDWNGEEVSAHVRAAAHSAIDETTAVCVGGAKEKVRVTTRILQGSIQFRPSVDEGSQVVGRWGSFDVNYAWWQEIKKFRLAGHQPYLRPTTDEEYPKLGARIRAYLRQP